MNSIEINIQVYDGFDLLLAATGREPLLQHLKLENLNIEMRRDGNSTSYIAVDDYQNTSISGVYALGDVCGHVELTPMAIAAGRRLSDRY